MARTYKAGVLITGDSKGAVKAVNLTAKEVQNLDKTTAKSSDRMRKSLDTVTGSLQSMQARAVKWGAAFGAAATAATVALVKSGLQSTDSLAKTADKLGVTTEALARYRFAAAQTGVEQGKADVALQRFTRRLADAAAGAGPAVQAFEALGLEAGELVNLSPDQAFAKVADQMRKVDNQSQKVSLAFKLFDSEGVALVNTLEQGSEGLAALGAQADAAGLAISRVDAAKVEAANDAMARIQSLVTGFSQQLAVKFAPILEDIADRIFGISQESGGMAKAAGDAFNFILRGVGLLGDGIRGLSIAWTGLQLVSQKVARFVVSQLDIMARGVFELWQKLPWVDKAEYESAFDGFLASMDAAVQESQDKLEELTRTPLPSQQLEQYAGKVERAFVASAAAVAASQQTVQAEVITTAQITDALSKKTKEATKKIADSWKETKDLLSQFLTELSTDGLGAFDTLFDGFKSLLTKMSTEAASAEIFDFLKGTFSGGGGGLGSLLGLTGPKGAAGFGLDLGSVFKDAGGFKSLAAGGLGYAAGESTFGEQSGVGATIGGVAGALIGGPLGAAIGSFLGAGAEKILGGVFGFGQNNGNNQGFTSFDLSTGARDSQGVGKSFEQANVDTSAGLVDALAAFAAQLGGSAFSGKIEVGNNSGISFIGEGAGGNFGRDTDAALAFGFRRVIEEATALDDALKPLILSFRGTGEEIALFATSVQSISENAKINTVTNAIEAFANGAPTLLQAYENQSGILDGLIGQLDGSAESVQAVAQAFAAEKAAAYDFAIAIQQAGAALKSLSEDQAQSIRESVLSEDQLRARRLNERDELLGQLEAGAFQDPARAEEAARRILELNQQVFSSLSEEIRLADFENFARVAETVGSTIGDQFRQQLGDLETRQSDRNAQLDDLLLSLAQRNEQSAQAMQNAVNQFGEWVQLLPRPGLSFANTNVGSF